ncbi:MAG: type II toxin-antitoxin system VapC family toxin [Eggerthellaceae bacterium]|nr:type II toxin-antitoxin system VapC family toxin [Eggerthellaceae bacterium]
MIVMDCSAAVEVARNTERGSAIRLLMDPTEDVIAPTLFRAEVRNAFWKYVHVDKMGSDDALLRIDRAESLVTHFVHIDDYLAEAFAEAVNHDHSVYDMLYLCLARRNAATLFTTDKRLVSACIEAKVNCIEEVDF